MEQQVRVWLGPQLPWGRQPWWVWGPDLGLPHRVTWEFRARGLLGAGWARSPEPTPRGGQIGDPRRGQGLLRLVPPPGPVPVCRKGRADKGCLCCSAGLGPLWPRSGLCLRGCLSGGLPPSGQALCSQVGPLLEKRDPGLRALAFGHPLPRAPLGIAPPTRPPQGHRHVAQVPACRCEVVLPSKPKAPPPPQPEGRVPRRVWQHQGTCWSPGADTRLGLPPALGYLRLAAPPSEGSKGRGAARGRGGQVAGACLPRSSLCCCCWCSCWRPPSPSSSSPTLTRSATSSLPLSSPPSKGHGTVGDGYRRG